jgi:hypothetical protein
MRKFLFLFLAVSCSAQVTPNLGFNVPTPGTPTNNWGTLVNSNFNALDNYLSGVASLAKLSVFNFSGGAINGTLNPAVCGSLSAPSWCSGSDLGGWTTAAYNYACGLPGGTGASIYIPAGTYPFSRQITIGSNLCPVTLRGSGSPATWLQYSGSGTAITVNTGSFSNMNVISDFKLTGPPNGWTGTTTGISITGSNNGATMAFMARVLIADFGTGLSMSGTNTWKFTGLHIQLADNGVNLSDSIGQENNACYSCIFSNTSNTTYAGSVALSGTNGDWSFFGSSFDNAQLAVSGNHIVHIIGGHQENPSLASYSFDTLSGANSVLEMTNVTLAQDNTSSFPKGYLVGASAGHLTIEGGTVVSGTTIGEVVDLSGTANFSSHGVTLNSGTFTNGLYISTSSGSLNACVGGSCVFNSTIQAKVVREAMNGTAHSVGATGNSAGTHTDGGFYQTASASGCTTGSTQGNACSSAMTMTWPVAFADTNYRITCTPSGAPTNYPSTPYAVTLSAGSATVNYIAVTAAAASWPTVVCEAIHN